MPKVFERFENRSFSSDLGDSCIQAGLTRRFEINELIDVHAGDNRATNSVKGIAS